jgi:hypothetical protein
MSHEQAVDHSLTDPTDPSKRLSGAWRRRARGSRTVAVSGSVAHYFLGWWWLVGVRGEAMAPRIIYMAFKRSIWCNNPTMPDFPVVPCASTLFVALRGEEQQWCPG